MTKPRKQAKRFRRPTPLPANARRYHGAPLGDEYMVTRIAHLSDLHFGEKFKVDTWTAVRNDVIEFAPHLLVVSGDLVDHPSPLHLLAAKGELYDLVKAAKAELAIVPGNHDLYTAGNRFMQGRADWFDRIFRSGDTTKAEAALAEQFGEPPRFTETYRKQSPWTGKVRRWFELWTGDTGDFTDLLPAAPGRSSHSARVISPSGIPVLLALLDSNAEDQTIGTATGSVSAAELLALREDLRQREEHYLTRIAVIHHHVLPIAFVGGRLAGAEPFMVLHNAGSVMSVLAEHRFDLVLHGHQHQQQFARVDFDPRTADGYPLAVAAAGSAALESRYDPRGNSYNRIWIHENGQIEVKSLFYGAESGPNADPDDSGKVRVFQEPLSTVKRRSYIRARERHWLECERWRRDFEVTEHGDLKVSHEVEELRLARSNPKYLNRPHDLFHAPHGRLVEPELYLNTEAVDQGYTLKLDAAGKTGERRCWVTLPRSPCDGSFASYTLHHGYANTLTMTRWEALELWRLKNGEAQPQGEWDQEWVGTRITHPVQELRLHLRLPDGLRAVRPFVECRRHPDFPGYKIDDDTRDAIMPPEALTSRDEAMRDHENERLSYDPFHRTWELAVSQPMVGYNYQLRWRLPPADTADPGLLGDVVAWQRQLLQAADRTRQPAAWDLFDQHREAFDDLLRSDSKDDDRGFELFVYERSTLNLVPAFSYRSWADGPLPRSFTLAPGVGMAGTAFQQRRTVPWSCLASYSPFIHPVPYPAAAGEPGMELRTMIAIPVYHPETAEMQPSPPPWSAIGVVCFSSSSERSKIAGMCTATPDTDARDAMITARGLAQSMADHIRGKLAPPRARH
jgi:3',5'-cyclic AMP phosphodiesterase CpdA